MYVYCPKWVFIFDTNCTDIQYTEEPFANVLNQPVDSLHGKAGTGGVVRRLAFVMLFLQGLRRSPNTGYVQ
jgi:hypothetical protein